MAFGDDMLLSGEQAMRQLARRRGVSGVLRLLLDLVLRLPVEYLAELRQDLRYAVRALIKSPSFALVGILSMSLGIGLTTEIYSRGSAVILRHIPVANADRLVTPDKPVSYPYIEHFRDEHVLFAGVAAVRNNVQFNVGIPQHSSIKPERVFGQIVSPDYFSVLGLAAQRGRVFNPLSEKPGSAPVVVISDRFWRSRLNADPDAVGESIRVNGQLATIIGITPRKFDGALSVSPIELFVSTTSPPTVAPELANNVLSQPFTREFQALIALQPGVRTDQAEAALDGVVRRLDKDDPLAAPQTDHGRRVTLLTAGTQVPMPREARAVIIGFYFALMTIITAIACLNLATMLLARCANRRKELAIRLGVGASRFRLIRQMITEGILLSLIGGGLGFVFAYAYWLMNAQIPQPAGAPISPNLAVDWRAALFAFILAFVCGVGFSLVPAFQATRTNVAPALKEGAALQLSGYRRFGFRNLAIATQVAGALMLLLITGFLALGLLQGGAIQTSFDQNTMGFLSVDPVRDGYTPDQSRQFFIRLDQHLRSSNSIPLFSFAAQPPYQSSDSDDGSLLIANDSHIQQSAGEITIGPGYFSTLSQSLLAGREFDQRDMLNPSSTTVVPLILNRKAALALFPKANAIGKHVHDLNQAYEVVGIVPDTKDAEGAIQPLAYLPLTQREFLQPPAGGITIIVRGNSAADALNVLRNQIAALDPGVTPFNAQTLAEYLDLSRYAMRSALRMFGGIGLFGLILSAIGLAGVTAYTVAQRRKEIGIRMVLGARKSQVLRLVLRESLALILAGCIVGFLGATALAHILSFMTTAFGEAFTIGTGDPRLIFGAPLLLGSLTLLACYLPARKATTIDPIRTLRQE